MAITVPMTATNAPQSRIFGNTAPAVMAKGKRTDSQGNPLPDAKFWCNIGFETQVFNKENTELVIEFISLGGFPIDTIEVMDIAAGKTRRAQTFAGAKNALREQFMEQAEKLLPGTSKIYGERGGVQYQILAVSLKEESEDVAVINAARPKLNFG